MYPDGRAVQICEGVIGVRFRESLEHPTLIEPGKVYEYTISLWETSNVFKPGIEYAWRSLVVISPDSLEIRIRASLWNECGHQGGEQIYHEAQYPSHFILPVIP